MLKLFNNSVSKKEKRLKPPPLNRRDFASQEEDDDEVELLRSILDSTEIPIFSKDINGIVRSWNKSAEETYGYKEEEIVGKSVSTLFPDSKKNELRTILSMVKNGKSLKDYETVRETKDGRLLDVLLTIVPIKKAGDVVGASVVQHDITQIEKTNENLERINKAHEESKQAMLNVMEDLEEAKDLLEQEKVKTEAMFTSIGEGLIGVDNDRKITIMNKAAENMLGRQLKDVIGHEITSLPLEDEEGNPIPTNKRPTYSALTTGKLVDSKYFFVRKDKTRFPIAINVTPVKLDGKVIGAIDIFRDITEERKIDKAKSEFVSVASHQLRTPLGIAKWYLEAIKEDGYFKDAPKKALDYIDEIYKSNERLISLVRDLLSVSRIDQGQVKDKPQNTDVAQLVDEVVKEVGIMAAKKKIKLNTILGLDSSLAAFIDPIKFHEVIENLVSNAIEYTPAGGTVKVYISKYDGQLVVSIKDTGIGISLADNKKLFTKFFRSEKGVSSYTDGSGLGLYVVKSYVEGWGGKISVDSAENKGSTFTVTIPIKLKEPKGASHK